MIIHADRNRPVFWIFAGLFIASLFIVAFTGEYFWVIIPFGIALSYFGWQNISILFFVLLATLPFSAEYHFTSELGTDIPDEALMLITAGLSLLYVIYNPEIISKNSRRHPLLIFLFFSILWIFTTALFSTGQFISFKFFLAKCWYLGAFVLAPLIVFKNKKNIETVGLFLLLPCLLLHQSF